MKTSLYVHIPFCFAKCLYCSFAVVVGQKRNENNYLQALKKEAEQYAKEKISTIYIGGGTPSLLEEEGIKNLFLMLQQKFDLSICNEITFECNPEHITLKQAHLLKTCGVNRISLGVQSFQPTYLKSMGRRHHGEDVIRAYEILRTAHFNNINVDLMYGFTNQTMDELYQDLEKITQLNSEHISVYALNIEPKSLFFVRNVHVDVELQTQMYKIVYEFLEQKSFKQYEVSNFSKIGFESKHNIHYWMGGNYIGLGMGAHSHINGRRFWNVDKFQEYLAQIKQQGLAIQAEEILDSQTRLMERILFGLRMNQGVCLAQIEKDLKVSLSRDKKQKISSFINEGFLKQEKDFLKTTLRGRLVLDEMAVELI